MVFLRDRAVGTLLAVLRALEQGWQGLNNATRRDVAVLIRRHGPDIAVTPATTRDEIRALLNLLEALWPLAAQLPSPAVKAMESGQGGSEGFGTLRLDPVDREALLAALVRLTDFRSFRDPTSLAEGVSSLISAHQDRLSAPDRAAWFTLDRMYRQGGPPEQYLRGVDQLLGQRVESLHYVLEAEKLWQPELVLRDGPRAGANDFLRRYPSGQHLEQPDGVGVIQRHANVHFPNRVLITQRLIPLVVHISCAPDGASAAPTGASGVNLSAGEVIVLVSAAGFTVERAVGGHPVNGTATARAVEVGCDCDCEPIVFLLTPQTEGRHRMRVDLYQFKRNLLSLAFDVDVTADPLHLAGLGTAVSDSLPVPSAARGTDATPPDLELRVMLAADGRTLSYMLHSPKQSDYHFKPMGEVVLLSDPLSVLRPIYERLSSMARASVTAHTAEETAQIAQELSDIGTNLYHLLFPASLRAEYQRLRSTYRGKTLMLTSDEPWIPWEIVKPFESDERGKILYDDPPLCEMFHMSRWLAGRGAPDLLTLRQGAWVAPADNLKAAEDESAYFQDFHRQQWQVTMTGPLSKLVEVERCFAAGRTELFHFACHGNFNTEDPDESKLKLSGGFLRPSQLTGARLAGLLRARPLMFLNTCHSGRAGTGLTRIGGWAQRFVEAGASAFIGSLWEIDDRLAARFAKEFYDRLFGLHGQAAMPLARAFHEARMVVKEAGPGNPTWLAYVLYGDPCAEMVLGEELPRLGLP